jgi:hypothetical protein
MTTRRQQHDFVVCVRADGETDLEPRKLYRVIPDPDAARRHMVRVVDESGEDYLYPAEYFVAVRVSARDCTVLAAVSLGPTQ